MNWFKWLFRKELKKIAEANLSNDIGNIAVIQTEPEKDISEPVFTIVECMKKYPSRFKVRETGTNTATEARTFKLWDTKSTQKLECIRWMYNSDYYDGNYRIVGWDWLTADEKDLLIGEFTVLAKNKLARLNSLQRAKIKGIYK